LNKLLLGILMFAFGQIVIWYQTNGQFISKWVANHPLIMAITLGVPISYSFILGTKYIVEHFDGQLWPGRLLGFGIGAICFGILTYIHVGEGITPKTAVSLVLAIALVMVQVLWKT
tara:strand:+ start:166 stop:513 length:348 start_codon:yes stop_codon:yes gene_type:complete